MMNLPPSNPNPWDSLLDLPSFRAALDDPENRRRISEAYARPIIEPLRMPLVLTPSGGQR
jgi:hypothetical protein